MRDWWQGARLLISINKMINNEKSGEGRGERSTDQEISAGILVYRKTIEGPKFLLLYHGHDYWNFAKGKIENEEKSFEAAVRETREETGLTARDLRFIRNFKTYERFNFKRSGKMIYKTVIFYMAETNEPRIRISKEHQGYGWFLYREASRILGKYRDSQKVLKNAYDFLRRSTGSVSQGKSVRSSGAAQIPAGRSPLNKNEIYRKSVKSGQGYPPRANPHLQRSGAPRRQHQGGPGGRQYFEPPRRNG